MMETPENNTGLTFLEKIVLLALDDKGWFGNTENNIKFGLAGAVLYEMIKRNKIELKEGVVVVKDPTPLSDPYFDKVLEFIRSGKKNRSIRTWIQRMVFRKVTIRKGIIRSLMAKKVIRKEEYSIFWVMYQFKYPILIPAVKQELREEIFNRILKEEKPGGYDLMMISVMDSCKMIRKNFRNFENYPRLRKKIREILEFSDPGLEDVKLVSILDSSIRRAIQASSVSIHA